MNLPLAASLTLAMSSICHSAESIPAEPPLLRKTETAADHAARMKWFQDARFGLFIHWGVYAVPAGEYHGKPVDGYGEWIMRHGAIPTAEYRAMAQNFTASGYDPKAWAALAKEAGMKYVVITSKHHDGFALYDSKISDWNAIKASGAKRDLIAPLAEAVRAEGMKFGLYYSQAQDWNNPGGGISRNKAGDNSPWDLAQKGDFDEYLKNCALPQVKEILTRYQPDVIWWDTPAGMTRERCKPFVEALDLVPGIISNNRLGIKEVYPGDTKTPERRIPPRGYPGEVFEVCMTMNDTWGYKKNDHNWLSVQRIIRCLSDISSKGGNFLLNVGPDAEGRIPEASIARLRATGRWMKANGEAIYATQAGPFPRRMPWGRATQKPTATGGTTLFLHVWEWPEAGELLLPGLAQLPLGGRVLVGGAEVTARPTAEGIVVKLPGSATDPDVSIVRLDFAKPLSVTGESFPVAAADGNIYLSAYDADTNGNWTGNIQLAGSGANAYLNGWTGEEWWMEYLIKTPAAKTWKITAEVALEKPSHLTLQAADKTLPVELAATGGAAAWKTVDLGQVELPAGETRFELHPVKEGWSGGPNVRKVQLTPVR